MAANATTNPSQLLPLGNRRPLGSRNRELTFRIGGRGAVPRQALAECGEMYKTKCGSTLSSKSSRQQAAPAL
ncbi:LSM5 isoform 3 [Pan troglodytes]|uniref:LSM5 homolog, U6 small nuclear RNA and mRNA degradation associated n=2 Tax=Homininae TaxID=207598 RepID=F8W8Y8_HUMAN|nr:LSM5-like, U6 small nuclear RNA and mRNA degradation associated [Homo sapiens]KAI4013387.1 LSM5 homolog, U6 small nuclear RNA and mRNA degradation associated [Homo sapiens]PNI35766.1 LSM5 isoform 3 [Pan troglodytes]